jgi:hypothetical protein
MHRRALGRADGAAKEDFCRRFDIGIDLAVARAYLDEPWNYVELTSIEAESLDVDGRGAWRVTAEVWNSPLEVLCLDWSLTSDAHSSAACQFSRAGRDDPGRRRAITSWCANWAEVKRPMTRDRWMAVCPT